MTDTDLDRRLGALLREPEPAADPAFAERVVAAARLDKEIRRVRGRAWRRAAIDCAGAIAVAAAFFVLSQEQAPLPGGMMSLYGPAMAGMIMLGLWALVALPIAAGARRA